MRELISHLEYLLLQHECVIIPDFGGFVLNRESSVILEEKNLILPPSYKIGFNCNLKFNDGLLAGSYMQRKGISFEVACEKINNAVKYIKFRLNNKQNLDFGKLGAFAYINGEISFKPNDRGFTHPDTWGYGELKINSLNSHLSSSEKKASQVRKAFISIASAAAILLIFLFLAEDNNSFINKIQQSGFFYNLTVNNVAKEIDDKIIVTDNKEEIVSNIFKNYQKAKEEKDNNRDISSSFTLKKEKTDTKNLQSKRYYIIVGGDTNKSKAESFLIKIRNENFHEADIVESPERYRIYVANFSDLSVAETYLKDFRKNYPTYHDAWVYTR